MSYLLDKKEKRKKFSVVVFVILILPLLFYFRSGVYEGFSYVGNKIFYPVLVTGHSIGTKFSGIGSFFISKNSLYLENQKLQTELDTNKALMSNYNSLLGENISLKEILGRKNEKTLMILATILSKPNQSPYDTLVIDVGTDVGIQIGNTVFALGNIPIGRVADVYTNSSKVTLFSNNGEKTGVLVSTKNIFMEIIGRGGGNFEIILPRDMTVLSKDEVVLPGPIPYVVGIIQTIISDPRDPYAKVLLVSPVNVQELKFVQVEKNNNLGN